MKKALITGVTGQDGSYLTEHLLSLNYEVHGVRRRVSVDNAERLAGSLDNPDFHLHYGDLTDGIDHLIRSIEPDEIYNLAAQSHVGTSFELPVYTLDVAALGATRILETIRHCGFPTRYYQASSSEIFGESPAPQDETTPMLPQSPYGVAKLAAYRLTQLYRRGHGLFAANGILFNHESPRRGSNFVTQKIVQSAVRISLGRQKVIRLGNLEAKRDWGHSRDYVRAMHQILQHHEADDFVVATGVYLSCRVFAERVFDKLGLRFDDHVEFAAEFTRPTEVAELCGVPAKIETTLGWKATCDLDGLIEEMIEASLLHESHAGTASVSPAQPESSPPGSVNQGAVQPPWTV